MSDNFLMARKYVGIFYPNLNMDEINKQRISQRFTEETLNGELNTIEMLRGQQIVNLFDEYSKTAFYRRFLGSPNSATDNLINQIREVQDPKLCAEITKNFLKESHETGFCVFLLVGKLTTLKNYSQELVASQTNAEVNASAPAPGSS